MLQHLSISLLFFVRNYYSLFDFIITPRIDSHDMSQANGNNGDEGGSTDHAESTDLRFRYRKLLFQTKEKRSELVRPESTGLLETLEEMNQLFSRVKNPREAVYDSNVLKLTSELGLEQADNLQTNMTVFDRNIFSEKLVTYMDGRCRGSHKDRPELDWSKLGKYAASMFNVTAKLDLIYGPLAMESIAKTRAARERNVQKKPTEAEKKKPQQLQQEEQEESTTKEVQRVLKAIHKLTDPDQGTYRHVPFFEFITDPTSFPTTIENMFHLSFLVKDGKVKLFLDEDNVPVVKINVHNGAVITSTPGTTRAINPSQVVISLTIQKWKNLIDEFNITKAMVPNIKRRVK